MTVAKMLLDYYRNSTKDTCKRYIVTISVTATCDSKLNIIY